MSETSIRPVILCGGSGTRLWPLSRRDHPKQFLALGADRSLLAQAIERSATIPGSERPLLVAGEDHRFFARAALEEAGCAGLLLLEPVARNTAAAIAAAALVIAGEDAGSVLVVQPSDHFIKDSAAFASALSQAAALAAASDAIALVGIRPTGPHTGYGYIEPGAPVGQGDARAVASFHEKPDAERARDFVDEGFLWNAGVFVARADTLVAAFEKHAPDILAGARAAVAGAQQDQDFLRLDRVAYEGTRAQSIDYAVMEAYPRCVVVPYAGDWSDLGSWDAVGSLYEPDGQGNRTVGDAIAFDSRNTMIVSEHRLAVTVGLQDVTVIDAKDSVLIAANDRLDGVRDVVALLKQQERAEADTPVKVERPWGNYEVLSQGPGYQMKRIVVKPGGKLSLQYHHHRAEHWIVVEGQAEVTRGDEVFTLSSNESTFIPLGAVHRLHNPHAEPVTIIEVQTGTYLGEDDIVRVEDVYGRENDGKEKAGPSAAAGGA